MSHTFRGPSGRTYFHNGDFSGNIQLSGDIPSEEEGQVIPVGDIEALYGAMMRSRFEGDVLANPREVRVLEGVQHRCCKKRGCPKDDPYQLIREGDPAYNLAQDLIEGAGPRQDAAMRALDAPLTRDRLEEIVEEAVRHAVNPNQVIMHNGRSVKLRDISDPSLRSMHGIGHNPYDIARREWHVYPYSPPEEGRATDWPWSPLWCGIAGQRLPWVWIKNNTALACPGCGIDGT